MTRTADGVRSAKSKVVHEDGAKQDPQWSGTPLLWILIVMVTPAICFAGGMIVVDARRHSEFMLIDWWALAAIFLPVTVGTLLSFWAVKVLLVMSRI
ncbi:MAG: hypothetical protein ACREIC_22360 [Limisphaerales bacterium]